MTLVSVKTSLTAPVAVPACQKASPGDWSEGWVWSPYWVVRWSGPVTCVSVAAKKQQTKGRTEEGEKHTTNQASNAAAQTKTHGLREKQSQEQTRGRKKHPENQANVQKWRLMRERGKQKHTGKNGKTQNNRPKPREHRTEKKRCACACLPVTWSLISWTHLT